MNKPSHNACAMFDAIKSEYEAAHQESRDPSTRNVLTIFRQSMNPLLSESEIHKLFDYVFRAYLEVTVLSSHSSN